MSMSAGSSMELIAVNPRFAYFRAFSSGTARIAAWAYSHRSLCPVLMSEVVPKFRNTLFASAQYSSMPLNQGAYGTFQISWTSLPAAQSFTTRVLWMLALSSMTANFSAGGVWQTSPLRNAKNYCELNDLSSNSKCSLPFCAEMPPTQATQFI